ncbi:MAG: inorganic phosphate transporter [Candidatus Sumerlaeota bacterium]|nr:inorganic phosphate transporter [Candidatus Sumerlaeota bacterium]
MTLATLIVFFTLLCIVIFAFTNGLHDVSNIIATMISSGAMTPKRAIIIAGFFEFLGPMLGGTMVAGAVMSMLNVQVIFAYSSRGNVILIIAASVLAAISWNLVTWYLGLPSSSSHALFGGIIGGALTATQQTNSIQWGFSDFNIMHVHGFAGVAAALFLSPFAGFIMGYLITLVVHFFLRGATPSANRFLKRAQVVTSSALAFSHGSNDVQKSMGLMVLTLMAAGFQQDYHVPYIVKLICALFIMLGALMGGWRIMKTVGRGIFRLRTEHSFDTQMASTLIILGNSLVGGPVSTTHIVSTTVMGVGTAVRMKAVRWAKVREIIVAWLITLPASFILGGIFYLILSPLGSRINFK